MSTIFLPAPSGPDVQQLHPTEKRRKTTASRPPASRPLAAHQAVAVPTDVELRHDVVTTAAAIDPVLRLPKVAELTGCAHSTWLRYVKDGHAPRGIRLGPNTVGWFQSSIVAWLKSRPQA